MLLAELNVRHTRWHMPTRRVALGDFYLPTAGVGYGVVLLGAVVGEFVGQLDEDQRELLPALLHEAAGGLSVPRLALRYRLQTDVHGLDRSRHRIVSEDGVGPQALPRVVVELDAHGRAVPQVIGAVLAAAAMGPTARVAALKVLAQIVRHPALPEGLVVRRLAAGVPGLLPFAPGETPVGVPRSQSQLWAGVPAEHRWAMEVLGLTAGMTVARGDVQARFRRLARIAHPDHGGGRDGAAERLAELSEARAILLAVAKATAHPDAS